MKEWLLVFLYVGWLVMEKNLEVFFDFELLGEKWLVGDGL